MANNFSVSTLTQWGGVPIYLNSMTTCMLATPFTEGNGNATIGQSLKKRYPIRLQGGQGLAATESNDVIQRYLNITWGPDTCGYVKFSLGAMDTTTSIGVNTPDAFFNEYINNGMVPQLANQNEFRLMEKIEQAFSGSIGSPSTVIAGLGAMNQVDVQFANMALNKTLGTKFMGMSPNTAATVQVPYASYFDQNFVDPILRKSPNKLGVYSGIECYMDQFISSSLTHTNGDWMDVTAPVIAAIVGTTDINAAFTTLSLTGCVPNATVRKGDLLVITSTDPLWSGKDIQEINGSTYTIYGNRKTFVVRELAVVDGTGDVDIKINPIVNPIPGQKVPYQNVNVAIVDGDSVSMVGGNGDVYTKNICFAKQSLLFGNPSLWPTPIGSGKQGDSPAGLAAFPYQAAINHTIKENGMPISYNIVAQGDITSFDTTYVGRTMCIPAAYDDLGFMFLSPV